MSAQNHYKKSVKSNTMAKELNNLNWIEELLPKGYLRKPMFGGFAYYFANRLILVMFENHGDRTYKNKKFDFEIWNGCLFPAEREHHFKIKQRYPFLINHPVLPKWLYLTSDTEDFEAHAELLLKELRRENLHFGVVPKVKNKIKKIKEEPVDMKRPRMFSDAPAEEKLNSAQRLSDLKNFGPATEKHLLKAGIKTVSQFVKLGWKGAMRKLVTADSKNAHSLFAYAVIGALKNQHWSKISEADKLEARNFMKQLRDKKNESKKHRQ